MAKKGKPFGGRSAAPFKAGGGRDQSHPRTAKGEPRKGGKGPGMRPKKTSPPK